MLSRSKSFKRLIHIFLYATSIFPSFTFKSLTNSRSKIGIKCSPSPRIKITVSQLASVQGEETSMWVEVDLGNLVAQRLCWSCAVGQPDRDWLSIARNYVFNEVSCILNWQYGCGREAAAPLISWRHSDMFVLRPSSERVSLYSTVEFTNSQNVTGHSKCILSLHVFTDDMRAI